MNSYLFGDDFVRVIRQMFDNYLVVSQFASYSNLGDATKVNISLFKVRALTYLTHLLAHNYYRSPLLLAGITSCFGLRSRR